MLDEKFTHVAVQSMHTIGAARPFWLIPDRFVAKSLLNLNYRMRYYEELLKAADRYMNHGQAEPERMKLLRAIEKVKDIEIRTAKEDIEDFGLE